jgi:hypothetical protein
VRGGVLSGDYFGVFSQQIKELIAEKVGQEKMAAQFVGMMSNGTSGDANCIDFYNPGRVFDYLSVGKDTAQAAMHVWPNIQYFDSVPLAMVEKRITIGNRVPTPEEVQAAKDHVAKFPDGKPQNVADVYATNVAEMGDWPKTCEVVVQAIRIGELAITALPAEVYGSTGLEIKARSPFHPTLNIGLANGNFGYLVPPEQHVLGGYNSWRTKYSCMEVDAETKIKATAIELLKSLHGNEASLSSPLDAVRQFQVAMMSGNTEKALALFTPKAQEEYQRRGLALDSEVFRGMTFRITGGDALPEAGVGFHAVYVDMMNGDERIESVWGVRKTEDGFRIASMVMKFDGGVITLDFENLEESLGRVEVKTP